MISLSIKSPSTRYVGSKRSISDWIINNIKDLEFDTFLDAFGGTGTIGYHAKVLGKKIGYNDKLTFNYHIGKSLIENNGIRLSDKDLEFILKRHTWIKYPKFIAKTFKGIYYTDEENKWLDMVVTNIRYMNNFTKRSIAFNALCQSCIIKRPYNLFHRNNLYMRFAKVERNFRNKKNWDLPFEVHFRNFVKEINSYIFDNGRKNLAFNSDVYDLPTNYDMIYVDSPYMSPNIRAIDYRNYYHFLEGLVNYNDWWKLIDFNSLNMRFKMQKDVWRDKPRLIQTFDELFKKFRDSVIVVSYKLGGIPTENEIRKILLRYKNKVITKRKSHQYALSKDPTTELLFIAT